MPIFAYGEMVAMKKKKQKSASRRCVHSSDRKHFDDSKNCSSFHFDDRTHVSGATSSARTP